MTKQRASYIRGDVHGFRYMTTQKAAEIWNVRFIGCSDYARKTVLRAY